MTSLLQCLWKQMSLFKNIFPDKSKVILCTDTWSEHINYLKISIICSGWLYFPDGGWCHYQILLSDIRRNICQSLTRINILRSLTFVCVRSCCSLWYANTWISLGSNLASSVSDKNNSVHKHWKYIMDWLFICTWFKALLKCAGSQHVCPQQLKGSV